MYIPTITSWLHSQWQSYIAIKIALWVWPSQQFSSRCRTSNKILSTEHQYKNYFVTPKQRKLWKETNSETIFHSNRSWQVSRQLLKPKIPNNKFNLILDIFFIRTDVTRTAKHCIATVFWFQKITVIVPLQKFREKLSKGAITNDHSNSSTSPSRLSTNVTITEKPKKKPQGFLNKSCGIHQKPN